jgi:hypothetical protein
VRDRRRQASETADPLRLLELFLETPALRDVLKDDDAPVSCVETHRRGSEAHFEARPVASREFALPARLASHADR